jgi:urease accessory protein
MLRTLRARPSWTLPLLALAIPSLAHAHAAASGAGSSFSTGFLHPLSGLDHVLAMLAVGLWGAQLGPPALWALPVGFPLVMALGGVAGIVGLPLPSVEAGIALSVIVLGAVIALDQRPPLAVAWLLVAFFAVFHGYAHGVELPQQAGAVAFSAGFVMATGLIHLTGIGIGSVVHLRGGLTALRAGGTAISAAGLYLAWRLVAS